MRRTGVRLRAVAMVLALGVAGCGSGSDGQETVTGSNPGNPSAGGTVPAPPATTTESSAVGTTDVAEAGDPGALLAEARAAFGAPGAMAFLDADGSRWFGTSGTANLEGSELTPTSRFRIASITKPIVAFLVLDAVARGELSLDDVVGPTVGTVLRPDPPITVRMLLDHTSGVFNVADEGDIAADIAALTDPALKTEALDLGARALAGEPVSMPADLYVALAETHERYAEPGDDFHYSNPNYQLAVMVLEQATGSTLGELLRTRLVEPLGLQHTTVAPADPGLPEMHGYMPDAATGDLIDQTEYFLALGNGGSGGIISTPEELLRIIEAIVGGELLPPALAEDMKDATLQSDLEYGLGLGRYDLSCGRFYGHGGSVSGTQSIALASDERPAGVVAVLNLVDNEHDAGLLALAESMLCRAG